MANKRIINTIAPISNHFKKVSVLATADEVQSLICCSRDARPAFKSSNKLGEFEDPWVAVAGFVPSIDACCCIAVCETQHVNIPHTGVKFGMSGSVVYASHWQQQDI
jgi:hypothetical protein